MRKLLAGCAAALVLLTACARGTMSPAEAKQTLIEAFRALEKSGQSSITLSLQSTPESIQAIAGQDGGEQLPAGVPEKILRSSLTFAGNNAADPKDARALISAKVDGVDALEMRVIGTVLYLRADVAHLLQTFEAPPGALDELRQVAARPGFEFIGAALEGKWVALTGADRLGEQVPGPRPEDLTAEQRRLFAALVEALDANATVVSRGEEAVGTHLVATIPLRPLAQALDQLFRELAATVPGAPAGGLNPLDVPAEPIVVDAWVKDGELTRLEFDVVENAEALDGEKAPAGMEQFGLRMDVERFAGQVEPPPGAVEVDLERVFRDLFGGAPPSFR